MPAGRSLNFLPTFSWGDPEKAAHPSRGVFPGGDDDFDSENSAKSMSHGQVHGPFPPSLPLQVKLLDRQEAQLNHIDHDAQTAPRLEIALV